MESRLTSKGQVTIPKAMRDALSIGPGDTVRFFKNIDGHWVILPTVPVTALRGMFARPGRKPVSLRAMQRAIEAGAIESGLPRARR